jgi:hypothetical protein
VTEPRGHAAPVHCGFITALESEMDAARAALAAQDGTTGASACAVTVGKLLRVIVGRYGGRNPPALCLRSNDGRLAERSESGAMPLFRCEGLAV